MPPVEFSHYRVLSRLGQGGIGEVYLAADTSLDRNVAIKFLLDGGAHDSAHSRLLYPDDTRGLFRLAWTKMATLGDWDEAIKGFKRVVALEPEDSSAWVNLASAYAGKRDFESAVSTYQKAFALNPALLFALFVNHEYGFTLVETGRLAEAAAVFERMKKEADPAGNRGRGFRSLALLDMYRGQYAAASEELRQAIVLDQTYEQTVSEFRDRLYLVTALEAKGHTREAAAQWTTVDRIIAKLSLSPDWLYRPVKMKARRGRLAEAQRWLQLMQKTAGRATADSGVSRNTGLDRAYVDLAQAEIERAAGRTRRAVELLEPAHVIAKSSESLEALAAAYVAADRPDDAVKRYEELMTSRVLGNEGQELWLQAHLALGQLYERLNRPADARKIYTALIDRWKEGDDDLLLLHSVRERLAKLPPAAAAPSVK